MEKRRIPASLLAGVMLLALAGTLAGCGEKTDGSANMGTVKMEEVRLGTGMVTDLTGSTPGEAGKEAKVKGTITVCSALFDKDGKILKVRFDEVQPAVSVKSDGTFTTDLLAEVRTKRQLGDEYNMKNSSEIKKERYEQMNSFESWLVGKKVTEVMGMGMEDGYPTEGELKTTVTIKVTSQQKALQKAYEDAFGKEANGGASSGNAESTITSAANSAAGGASADVSRVASNAESMIG